MKLKLAILAILACTAAFAQTGDSRTPADPKGIWLDNAATARPAVKFSVQLDRDGERRVVAADYMFRSDDRMKFQFELNRRSYIYVLLHSVSAEGAEAERYAGTRGIEVIREQDRKAKGADSYQLLFPTAESGMNNLVAAHTVKSMPTAETAFFRMDRKPGMEKLFVVVSATPLDFSPYFDTRSGKLKASAAAQGARSLADDEMLGRLTRMLMDLSGNAIVSSAKGILIDSYAAASVAEKPMLIPVDLRHVAVKKQKE
jgi:hypothetical protein